MASNGMRIVSSTPLRCAANTMLPLVPRQLFQEYLQMARVIASACLAIVIGLVSLSYGIASLGLDTLADVAREIVAE